VKTLLLLLALLICSIAICNGQTNSSVDTTNLSITAQTIERQGSVLLCRGHVEIATDALVLHADEVDYHSDSGEAELRGNVRAKMRSTIKATCEGTGCRSAESPEPPAMAKIRETMAKVIAERRAQTPK
jgi:lipopolysaccharide assembly outer membrane protein LptD (OstA)